MKMKLIVSALILLFAVIVIFLYVGLSFRAKESVRTVTSSVWIPIKMLQLMLKEPDLFLLMPVAGGKVERIADTWLAPRGGEAVRIKEVILSEATNKQSKTINRSSQYIKYPVS